MNIISLTKFINYVLNIEELDFFKLYFMLSMHACTYNTLLKVKNRDITRFRENTIHHLSLLSHYY